MDRRAHVRRDFIARVEVHFQNEAGDPIHAVGMVEDRSITGMLIQVRESISLGSEIIIRSSSGEHKAIVRRSIRSLGGNRIGVEFIAAETSENPKSE